MLSLCCRSHSDGDIQDVERFSATRFLLVSLGAAGDRLHLEALEACGT